MSPRSYCEKPFWTGRGVLFFFLSILLCVTALGQEIEGIGEIEGEAPEAEVEEPEGIGETEGEAPEAEVEEPEGIGETEGELPEAEVEEPEGIGETEAEAPEAEIEEIEGIGEIEEEAPEIEEIEGIGEIEEEAPEIEETEGMEIEDEVVEIEEIEEVPLEEAVPSWRQWELGLQTGRMVLTGSASSKDTLAYGFYILYRLRGIGEADDGTSVEVQGRHGFELNVNQFKTDYNRTFGVSSGSDALPVSLNFGGTKLTLPMGWYGLEAEGEYAYTTVSVNYIYTQLNKRQRLRPVTFYAVGGGGYVFGSSDSFLLRGHVRQLCDPSDSNALTDQRCLNQFGQFNEFQKLAGSVDEMGNGSGICDVSDPLYNATACTNAQKALSFFDFEFHDATVITFGGGVRWQMSPRWVVNFEVRDFLMPFDDSGFLATGKKAVGEMGTRSEWTFDKQDAKGHSFLIRISIARNFQRFFGIGGGPKKQ
ncbi:MAG: hypothetical protein JSV08_09640 [Acidobacteriota bacterium]|nr:MAG: hypothetical protein JSV08_09640 [Acidobacteriota bacterium]